MANGYFYKYNATTASNSQAKKFNATTVSDGVIKHANATTWYSNYPIVTVSAFSEEKHEEPEK